MADVKQILVVDDHFEMLEFLRTVLEHSGRDYHVLAVPSAEEGMLELLRTPFDLLITDVRLPGMSGFDLIRRVRRARRDLPVIMISGYGIEQGQKEAAALGVVHYFVKPLDSDLLLQTVQRTLFGEPEPVPLVDEPSTQAVTLSPELSANLNQRIQTLRNEISATYITLADGQGRVLTESGIGVGLVTPALLSALAESLRHSQVIATHLSNEDAFTMHYQTGNKVELYTMTLGSSHLLLIFFTAESRRGRVGTVWVFAQRFAKELVSLLPQTEVRPTPAAAAPPSSSLSTVSDLPDFPAKTPDVPLEPSRPVKPSTPEPTPLPVQKPTPAMPPSPAPTDNAVFSFADALKQGLIPGELAPDEAHAPDQAAEAALADWLDLPAQPAPGNGDDWLDAAANEPVSSGEGLSFEEAMRLGLLPQELVHSHTEADTAEIDLLGLSDVESADLDLLSELEAASPGQEGAFSLEQAQAMGLLPKELGDTPPAGDDALADLFTLSPDEALDLDGFWEEAIAQETETPLPGLSLEEAQAEGVLTPEPAAPEASDLVPADLEALFTAPGSDEFDFDAFWDEAVAKEPGAAAPQGLSLEEARRRGLIQYPTWNHDE